MKNIWTRKDKNKANIILAPMAGYADSAMRGICKSFGADIVVSEMVSADAIYHKKQLNVKSEKLKVSELNTLLESDKTLGLMKFNGTERPFVVQLFGKYPEKFAYAAKWVEENIKPDGIDINMGCPARKVVGSDHGSALLKNPKLACEIVRAVKEKVSVPVSVKTRLGWENDDEILEFAPKLIKTGIDALIIHGRTYKDGFKGKARWKNIYKLKVENQKLKVQTAIIGNGDVEDYKDALSKSSNDEVKLDGVMIGRAAFGKPWIFSNSSRPTTYDLGPTILKHAKLAYGSKGEHGIIEFRKHLLAYLKGLNNAKKFRVEAVKVKSLKDVEEIIKEVKNQSIGSGNIL